MRRMCLPAGPVVVLTLVLPLVAPLAAFAKHSPSAGDPTIVLTALIAPAGDPVAERLASTITSSLDLVMHLTGSLTVQRADFLVPTLFLHRAVEYYRQVGADGAVFGSVTPDPNGSYTIDLEVWSAAKANGKPVVVRRTISNLLSSFDVADSMSLRVASTIVGRKLAEGTLLVKNVASLPSFSVYADGHLLGRNQTEFHVLTGRREIIVAKPGQLGDVPVEAFRVDIRQGATTSVALTVAPTSTSEAPMPIRAVPAAARPQPTTGKLTVTTRVAGTLYFDKLAWTHLAAGGRTVLPTVSAGSHTLEMVYIDGARAIRTARIVAGRALHITFGAEPFAPPPIAPRMVRTIFGKERLTGYTFEGVTYSPGLFANYPPGFFSALERVQALPATIQQRIADVRSYASASAGWSVGEVVGEVAFFGGLLASQSNAGTAANSSGSPTTGQTALIVGGGIVWLVCLIGAADTQSKENAALKSMVTDWNGYARNSNRP